MITSHHFGDKTEIMHDVGTSHVIDLVNSSTSFWIDIVSESKSTVSEILKSIFPEYHSIILEDITENTRPKIDTYNDFTFMVLKTYPYGSFKTSQFSVVLGKSFLITFRNNNTDLTKAFEMLNSSKQGSPDYMLYKILECIFDQYYHVLESVDPRIDSIEKKCLKKSSPDTLKEILELKEKLLSMHKNLVSEREVVLALSRAGSLQVHKSTTVFFRDIYDDIVSLMDMEETYRETLSGNMELYMSSVNNSMNEIMKTLTIITSFTFVPALIAGFYGMNVKLPFQNLTYRGIDIASLFILTLMAESVGYMYFVFRKKGWL